jgi:pilus assembly protein Flp/PilA
VVPSSKVVWHGAADFKNGAVFYSWSFHMKKFLKDESGATAIEYGLIAAAMGLALITAMPFITQAIVGKFTSLGTSISAPPV